MGWIMDAYGLLSKGGYVMIPLMACSVVSLAILIERFIKIRSAQADISKVINQAEEALYNGNVAKSLDLLECSDVPIARVLAAGIRNRHLGEARSRKSDGRAGDKRDCVSS